MRVTVIVPVYNKLAYLKRCIDSILQQTFRSFELIIVDDGSNDGSAELIKTFDDPRIRVISQRNAGPGAARNSGIKSACGELVAFLDADDEWLPTFLSESVALLDTAGRDTVAVTSGYFEFPQGKSSEPLWYKRGIRNMEVSITPEFSPVFVMHLLAFMSSWSTVIRRRTLERFGGFYSENHCCYAEDSFLWLKVLLNERVRFNLTPLVKFHREASSLSRSSEGPHPIEPFLLFPNEIRNHCPSHLKDLLEKVLVIRALKTVCVLGYWGRWRKARHLMMAYARPRFCSMPYFLPALVCSSPIGALLGKIWRTFSLGRMPRMYDLTHSGAESDQIYLGATFDKNGSSSGGANVIKQN